MGTPASFSERTRPRRQAHILVADDHAMLVDMLEAHLEKLGPRTVVYKAGNFAQAMAMAAQATRLDLILLDLHMPGMCGEASLRSFRQRFPDTPLAVMSGDNLPEVADMVFAAGARAFIPKTMGGRGMLYAVENVLAGKKFVPGQVYLKSREPEEGSAGLEHAGAGAAGMLTARQRDVLALLVAGHSTKAVAAMLGVAPTTVSFHLRKIYAVLDVPGRAAAVAAAIKLDLVS